MLDTIANGAVLQRYLPLIAYTGVDARMADAMLIVERLAAMPEPMHAESRFGLSELPARGADLGVARADLVTLTNVVHEIAPLRLPQLLRQALQLLRPGGILLAYDVTELTDGGFWEEAGTAVTWTANEISFVLESLIPVRTGSGPTGLRVSSWAHAQTSGWTLVARSPAVPEKLQVTAAEEAVGEVLRSMRARYDSDRAGLLCELGGPEARALAAAAMLTDLHPRLADCERLARPLEHGGIRALEALDAEPVISALGSAAGERQRVRRVAELRGQTSVKTLQKLHRLAKVSRMLETVEKYRGT